MELTLSLWTPLDKERPVRKLYKDGKKVDINWSYYWREIKAWKNEEITLSLIKSLKTKIMESDLNVCLGSNSPIDEIREDKNTSIASLDFLTLAKLWPRR